MDDFANYLSQMPESDNRLILNRTGLKGSYDFQMNWSREDLGLKIEPDRALVNVVVVVSVKKPEGLRRWSLMA